jgi:hypothetical protein
VATPIPVQRTVHVGEPPAAARERYLEFFTLWFGNGGWRTTVQTSDTVTYEIERFHTWQIVVAIIGFPIGLIALLAEKQRFLLTATFTPEGDADTAIVLTGFLPPGRLTDQIANRLDEFDPARRPAGTPRGDGVPARVGAT